MCINTYKNLCHHSVYNGSDTVRALERHIRNQICLFFNFCLFVFFSKFWTRNRPGDKMRDRYNLNLLPGMSEDGMEYGELQEDK